MGLEAGEGTEQLGDRVGQLADTVLGDRLAAAILRAGHVRCCFDATVSACTPARLCALRLLSASGEHLSCADVCTELPRLGLPFDQATVYRTLETLTDVGLAHLCTVQAPSATASAPYRTTTPSVRECGRVQDLAIVDIREAVERITEITGLRAGAGGSLLLYGRCAQCSE
ncbi:transcriptional repressor [Streptomyces sp. NPDC040750]|uniref:Fur family transcriptional regulator n=1 Tax=Streptomyces sp. NPDC040750 TaxID=3154491 RepID=UPI0033C8CB56